MNVEQANVVSQPVGAWPFGIGDRKLGMWLFIISDAMTFGALLAGYVYLRINSEVWLRPFSFWPEIASSALMTACLLGSSLTMFRAVSASSRGQQKTMLRWMLATLAGGIIFIILHLLEWKRLLSHGLTFSMRFSQQSEPTSLFGAVFFTLTGFHLLHVLSGLIYIGVTALRRNATREAVETCGLYWQFVDAVWLVIFPAIYLCSIK